MKRKEPSGDLVELAVEDGGTAVNVEDQVAWTTLE